MSDFSLPPEIRMLPTADRLELVAELWNSIADDTQSLEFTAAQKEELDRRLDRFKANPQAGLPWDEVKRRLQQKS